MRYLGLILGLFMMTFIFGLIISAWVYLIRGTIQRRKDRLAVQARCREAIERLSAKDKINYPKGKIRFRPWAAKWVDYANSLPAPSAQGQHISHHSELPRYPTLKNRE
jgi:hypothetical protein